MYDVEQVLKAYIRGQAGLGYADFDPGPNASDIILVTFPKSGSTWTSYILHQLRSGADEEFDDIKNEVIDITPGHWDPEVNPFDIVQEFSPRTYKTHGSYELCPKGAKYIYIARNPKDGFWSLYQFIHDLFALEKKMPIRDFYQNYYVDRFDTSHDIGNVWNHFLSWYQLKQNENLLWLHYEDLVSNTLDCLKLIAKFMEVHVSETNILKVLEHSKMSHMKEIASKINPSQENRVGKIVLGFGQEMEKYAQSMKFGKMRKGIAGDGKGCLPETVQEQLEIDWKQRITPHLGYSNYEEMLKANTIHNNQLFKSL